MTEKWFVRGVPTDLTRKVTKIAKERGLTVGRLVTDALEQYLPRLHEGAEPAVSEIMDLRAEVADLRRRIEQLEKRVPSSDRLTPTSKRRGRALQLESEPGSGTES